MTLRLLSLACAGLSLLGCNGDRSAAADTHGGTYAVTSHTRNATGCDGPGDAVSEYAHFRLEHETFFGQPILGWHDCDSATSCDDAISLNGSFVTKEGAWRISNSWSSGETTCNVGLTEGTITETSEGIRIEIRRYSGTVAVPTADDCQPEVAEARVAELDCDELEVIEATRI